MFEPNSIRSLLNKRQSSNLTSNQQTLDKNILPGKSINYDFQSTIEAKIMIQKIDNQVNHIRQWRKQQKNLTQQKLRHNEAIATINIEKHMEYLERQNQIEQASNAKILSKMNYPYYETQNTNYNAQEQMNKNEQNCQLLEIITQTDRNIETQKCKYNDQPILADYHEAFLNSVANLGDIFTHKKSSKEQKNENNINQSNWKLQLEEIDAQLNQIQELLKD